MRRIIEPQEFAAPGTLAHARSLLGRLLVRTTPEGREERLITEVEAYDGERDLASHARRGRTARTEVMYRAGGVWYVYLCYGVHEMLNLVVGPEDYPAAILIRGVSKIVGPGRLTKQLRIDRTLNGRPADPASGLHVEDLGLRVTRRHIAASPRVGIDYAGPVWAKKPWRFQLTAAAQTHFATMVAGAL